MATDVVWNYDAVNRIKCELWDKEEVKHVTTMGCLYFQMQTDAVKALVLWVADSFYPAFQAVSEEGLDSNGERWDSTPAPPLLCYVFSI